MLCRLGEPNVARSTEARTCAQLVVAMRYAGTQLILLDDFMDMGDSATQRPIIYIAEWLIHLICQTETRLVVAGPPSCSDLFAQAPRFARRLGAPIRLVRFSWNDDDSRQEFIAIFKSFQYELAKQCDVSILDSPDMVYLLYCASGGLIGSLFQLLRSGVQNAMLDRRSAVSGDDLAARHS